MRIIQLAILISSKQNNCRRSILLQDNTINDRRHFDILTIFRENKAMDDRFFKNIAIVATQ